MRQFVRFLRRPSSLVGSLVVTVFLIMAVAPGVVSTHDPYQQDLRLRLAAPTAAHPLGNDPLGRDVLSRVAHATRASLLIALAAIGLAVSIGIPLGLVAGYYRGGAESLIMRGTDVLLAFPPILLALAIIAIIGSGVAPLVASLGIMSVPPFIRLVRSAVLVEREKAYIEACEALGAPTFRVLGRHLLPNIMSPVIVQVTLRIPTAILTTAALGFLGLGVQPPFPEWGQMLSLYRDYMFIAPHTVLAPGLAITLVVVGFNFLGDSLRDVLDPNLQQR